MCWPYSLHWVQPSEATRRGAWLLNAWPRIPRWWWWWCWWWWFSSPSSSLSSSSPSPSHLTSSSPSVLLPIRCDSGMRLLNTLDASQHPRDAVQSPCMVYENFFPFSFSSLAIFPPTTLYSSHEWSFNMLYSLPPLRSEHAVSLSKAVVSNPTFPLHYLHWVIFSKRSLPVGKLIVPWSPILH